jgi:hypothetical protein
MLVLKFLQVLYFSRHYVKFKNLFLLQSLAMSASGQQLSNNTLVRKRGTARNSQMSAESSSATVDSALYSNVR